jgi:hypothetical protein
MIRIPNINVYTECIKYYKFDDCYEKNQNEQYQFYVSRVVKKDNEDIYEFYNMGDPQTLYLYIVKIKNQIKLLEDLLESNLNATNIGILKNKIEYLRNLLTFNECLLPYNNRKMYYDIDIPRSECDIQKAEEIKDDLITSLKIKLKIEDLSKEILLFTAHRENKFSYHIILPHIILELDFTSNNTLNKKKWANNIRDFHMDCISQMNEEHKKYVDQSIYSSFQNFRMLYQIKYGYNNPFIYDKWKYLGTVR